MIGRTLSHYRILEKLGEGGMGAVYLARDTRLKRRIALKVLPEEVTASAARLERFQREAESLAALNHPNIVMIHSVEEADGVHFLTMELVEGRPLSEIIPAGGLRLEKLFAVAEPLAAALAAAHSKGITHRDLKPDNVMITAEEGRVKVLDFGLAKLQQPDEIDLDLTALPTEVMTTEGSVLGTLPYMSPEQAEGKPVDHRTDIFSLGVILYQMATGDRPFRGDTAARLTSSILTEAPRPVTEVRAELPRQLGRIIGHCLEKEPHERFQSALDVRNELAGLETELRSGAFVPLGASAAKPSLPGISRRSLMGAAVAMMVLTAGLGIYFWRGDAPSPGRSPAMIASLVALPTDVFGPASEDYLTDAIPSTLSTHLAGLEGVDTKLPPTSGEVERIGGDLEKLSGVYQVGAFVRSTVTAEGAELVLSVQLVERATKSLLWGAEYRGRQDTYLDLVRRAAQGVRGYLRPSAVAVAAPIESAASSEAELALQRGRYASRRFNNHRRLPDFEIALSSLERALELDPDLAAAAFEIGALHIFRWELAFEPEWLASAERWHRRSLEIDPTEGGAWIGLSYIENRSPDGPDPAQALRYALKGAALDASNQFALTSVAHTVGNWSIELSIEAALESNRVHPLYLIPPINAAAQLASIDKADRSVSLLDQVLEIEPDLPFAHFRKSQALTVLDRFGEAQTEVSRVESFVEAGLLHQWMLEFADFLLKTERALAGGRMDDAKVLLDELLSSDSEHLLGESVSYSWLFARAGAPEQAVALLLAAADRGLQIQYDSWWVGNGLEEVRADPRLTEVIAASRRSFEEFVEILHEARERGELPAFLEEPLADLLSQLGMSAAINA